MAVGWERRREVDARSGRKDVGLPELEGDVPTGLVQEPVPLLARPAPLHRHGVGPLPGGRIEEDDPATPFAASGGSVKSSIRVSTCAASAWSAIFWRRAATESASPKRLRASS